MRTTDLVSLVRKVLPECDDLRRPRWKGNPNPTAGHCYVVSEVLYHSVEGLSPATVRHEGAVHWYLVDEDGGVLDATSDQFEDAPPYRLGRRRGFLTKEPSRRAKVLAGRCGLEWSKEA